MTGRRLLGAAILAGLFGLIAVQAQEVVRHQRRQPFDRRLAVRPEADIGSLAARSRSETVRRRYAMWYWLARELPGATILVPPGVELEGMPLRALADIRVRRWQRPGSLELSRRSAARLEPGITHRFRGADGELLRLVKSADASEYVLMTRGGAPYLLLPREDLGPRRRKPAAAN